MTPTVQGPASTRRVGGTSLPGLLKLAESALGKVDGEERLAVREEGKSEAPEARADLEHAMLGPDAEGVSEPRHELLGVVVAGARS